MTGMRVGAFNRPDYQVVVDVIQGKAPNECTVKQRQELKEWAGNKKLNQDEHYSEREKSKVEKHHGLVGRETHGNHQCHTQNDCCC